MIETTLKTMDREKRAVALSSVIAAVALTSTKLVVGVSTNSLGILSEAAHSGLDLVAAAVTFWAVRAAGTPADRRHTYGHGKIENLSALFETVLLLGTCAWIILESLERMTGTATKRVDASIWAFAVVILSIVVDLTRSRALMRVARKYQSQALEADALHFSTDIWSSGVVLVGLVGVRLAEPLGMAWLDRADTIAALVVACIVLVVSLRLAKRSTDELLDGVEPHLVDAVSARAKVGGVVSVGRVRLRRSGPECFADVTVMVSPNIPVSDAHRIANDVELAVSEVVPRAQVMVHVEPVDPQEETQTAPD